jgi:hypothetical protein
MSVDQLRLAESAIEAALVLGVTTLPTAWNLLDGGLATVLGAMWLLLASGVYSLHAVTFDSFRITGQRGRRIFSYTRSEE